MPDPCWAYLENFSDADTTYPNQLTQTREAIGTAVQGISDALDALDSYIKEEEGIKAGNGKALSAAAKTTKQNIIDCFEGFDPTTNKVTTPSLDDVKFVRKGFLRMKEAIEDYGSKPGLFPGVLKFANWQTEPSDAQARGISMWVGLKSGYFLYGVAPATAQAGRFNQAGVVVHEWSHLYSGWKNGLGMGTKDYGYYLGGNGQKANYDYKKYSDATGPGPLPTSFLINNADTFEQFAKRYFK